MDKLQAFALVLDADNPLQEYVIGIFPDQVGADRAAQWIPNPTNIYIVTFYCDETLEIGDYIFVDSVICNNKCIPKNAYILASLEYSVSEMSFTCFNPSKDYVVEFVSTIAREYKHLLEYIKTGVMPPDENIQQQIREEYEELDMTDEQRQFWNGLLASLFED